MTYRRGAWYLLGRDRDREAPRMFKVARVDAPAQEIGKPGSYQVPDVDLDAAWRRLEPRQADTEAIVAIRPGRAAELRRRGRPVEHDGHRPRRLRGVRGRLRPRRRPGGGVVRARRGRAGAVTARIRQSVITELKAVAGSLA